LSVGWRRCGSRGHPTLPQLFRRRASPSFGGGAGGTVAPPTGTFVFSRAFVQNCALCALFEQKLREKQTNEPQIRRRRAWAGPGPGPGVQLLAGEGSPRIGRIVLASVDAFDNFPPGLTGKTVVLTGKLSPAMFGMFMQQMRLRPVRRLPIAFGWLTKRGDAVTKG
jgi:hypothetical protein